MVVATPFSPPTLRASQAFGCQVCVLLHMLTCASYLFALYTVANYPVPNTCPKVYIIFSVLYDDLIFILRYLHMTVSAKDHNLFKCI